MSTIRYALEKLDFAVSQLDESISVFEQYEPQQDLGPELDVEYVAMRLDRAIHTVEEILRQGA